MLDCSKATDAALVRELIALKAKEKELKSKMLVVEAELQQRAISTMVDHNVKTVNFVNKSKNNPGSIRVTNSSKLEVLHNSVLRYIIGADVFDSKVVKSTVVDYKYQALFSKALVAICERDYDFDASLDEVFDSLGATSEQRTVLEKQLKGDFSKDNNLLISIFGDGEYEEELYFIYKILNARLIAMFIPDVTEEKLDEIRKCAIAKSKISITVNPLEGE